MGFVKGVPKDHSVCKSLLRKKFSDLISLKKNLDCRNIVTRFKYILPGGIIVVGKTNGCLTLTFCGLHIPWNTVWEAWLIQLHRNMNQLEGSG